MCCYSECKSWKTTHDSIILAGDIQCGIVIEQSISPFFHNRRPFGSTRGQYTWHLCKCDCLICVLRTSLQCCLQYRMILDCVITTLSSTFHKRYTFVYIFYPKMESSKGGSSWHENIAINRLNFKSRIYLATTWRSCMVSFYRKTDITQRVSKYNPQDYHNIVLYCFTSTEIFAKYDISKMLIREYLLNKAQCNFQCSTIC